MVECSEFMPFDSLGNDIFVCVFVPKLNLISLVHKLGVYTIVVMRNWEFQKGKKGGIEG